LSNSWHTNLDLTAEVNRIKC